MSDSTSTPEQRRWRDDALSVFLIIAAVVLGVMYVYEHWQTARLADQQALAGKIDHSFAIDGAHCEVSSTGLQGESLVVSCSGLKAVEVAAAAASVDRLADELSEFDRVVFRGANEQLLCDPTPAGWPGECSAQTLPSVDDTRR